MAGRKPPTKEVITERETQAWLLRQKGYTQEQIGEKLNVDQSTISRLLARLNDRALAGNVGRAERHKVEQTRTLWWMLSESLRSWEQSKEPGQRVRDTGKKDEDGNPIHVTDAVTQTGSVAYMHAARAVMADIRSIWGLDIAPATVEQTQGIAQLIQDLEARKGERAARAAEEGPAGDTTGVQEGAGGERGPVQP